MRMTDNSSATNPGFSRQDQWYLTRYDNASADPDIQILTEEDFENENLEQRHYFCAICKSRLDFLKETKTIWRCNECMQYYDTSIQDVPIKNIKDSRVKTYAELEHYHQLDDDDIFMPFVQGVSPDADEDIPSNIEVISDDGRHKHIRIKGLPIEALAAMNELDDKT